MGDAGSCELLITSLDGRDVGEIVTDEGSSQSVAKSCPSLFDPMNCSMPGFPVLHYLPEFAQTHVHRIHDAI